MEKPFIWLPLGSCAGCVILYSLDRATGDKYRPNRDRSTIVANVPHAEKRRIPHKSFGRKLIGQMASQETALPIPAGSLMKPRSQPCSQADGHRTKKLAAPYRPAPCLNSPAFRSLLRP